MVCLYLVSEFEQCPKTILYYRQITFVRLRDRIINFYIEITEKKNLNQVYLYY